ncbi:MAG: hypothetical protein ACXAB4_09330 [Candidatus Hodarchaeales archaeon]|jgi:hypothetical protein
MATISVSGDHYKQTWTLFEAMTKDLFRNRFTLMTMLMLPIFIFGIAFIATTDEPMPVELQDETVIVPMVDVHTFTASLTAIAILTGIGGFYMTLISQQNDRRLIMAGYRSFNIVMVKVGISLLILGLGSILIFFLTMFVLPPKVPEVFFVGVLGAGLLYAIVGILVANLIPKEFEGSILVLLFAFVDTMLITNPMAPGTYQTTLSQLFPGYAPVQLALDGGLTHKAANVPLLVGWILVYFILLAAVALATFWRRNRLSRPNYTNH